MLLLYGAAIFILCLFTVAVPFLLISGQMQELNDMQTRIAQLARQNRQEICEIYFEYRARFPDTERKPGLERICSR